MTLPEYLTANLGRKFQWGELDCVTFCARYVELSTGVNHLAGVPAWTSAKQALRLRHEMGGIEKLMDDRLKRAHPNLAKDGDIALCGNRICLFSGPHIVGPGHDGLVFISRLRAECAWSY